MILLATVLIALGEVLAQETDTPRTTDLVEETESRLTQLDVSVRGPADVIYDLGPDDFTLKVHTRWIEDFEVDRHCERPAETAAVTDSERAAAEATPAAPRPRKSYLFYFDQPHLTLAGRAQALDVARDLTRRLIRDGDRAMIVSNARRLTTIQRFEDDPQVVLEALDRLEADRSQWDTYASEEELRVARVVDRLNEDSLVTGAIADARVFQREEYQRTDKNLRRLRMTLARLSEVEPWRAVVYFADTMRQNPGAHYLSFFGEALQRTEMQLSDMGSMAFTGGVPFDQMVNEAVTHGIRLYPVYAQGLVVPFSRNRVDAAAMERSGAVPDNPRMRMRDSRETLASMASETGGHAFLRGESPAKIAEAIKDDFACVYTLSFDPSGIPEDDALRVVLGTTRDDLQLQTRGRVVLQSGSARLAARLLNAFTDGGSAEAELELRANLVPTGFRRGSYAALLQISVPGSPIPSATWDLGASLINRNKVLDKIAGRLATDRPDVPLVLERELTIRPGPHEIVAVAHEATTNIVLSARLEISWPDPDRRPVTCGPLTLLQPTTGAFVRAGDTRTRGSLARSHEELVRTAEPTALMSLICRNRRSKGTLHVARALIGDAALEFPALQFELDDDRCAQVRDLIPAESLPPGPYRYILRVLHEGSVLDEVTRDFVARGPDS
jgi:VWFA-related protein